MTAGAPALRRSLWSNRSFVALWGGQTISAFGTTVSAIILPLYAVAQLRASALQVGVIAAAAAVPFMLLGLPAGSIIGWFRLRRVMIVCDVGRAATLATVPIAIGLDRLTIIQLVVVSLVMGTFTVFFEIAYQSYLPALVDREQLVEGNGKLQSTEVLAESVGPGLAGALVSALGAALSVVLDVVSYVVSIVSLSVIRTPDRQVQVPRSARVKVRTDIKAGLSFLWHDLALSRVAAFSATANVFAAMYNALEIVFLVRVLHASAWAVGLVLTIGSIGGVLGGLIAAPLSRRIGSVRLMWVPVLTLGALPLLVPFATPGWGTALVGVGCFGNVASIVMASTAANSYRQAACPAALLNRVTASMRWLAWSLMPVGALLGGFLGTAIGVRQAVAVAVIGGYLSVSWVVFSPLRRMRDLHASEPTAPTERIVTMDELEHGPVEAR